MRRRHKQSLALLRRVHDFLVRTPPTIVMGNMAAQTDLLGRTIDRLANYAVEQDARARMSRSGTSSKRHLARLLRLEYLRPVTRVSRLLFPDDPSLRSALRSPKAADAEALIAAAHAMADAARSRTDAFVGAGFAPDFIERMEGAALALKVAIDGRANDLGRRAASTVGLQEEVAHGLGTVRLLDAMITPKLERDPTLLAEWKSLLSQGRTKKSEAEAETTPLSRPPLPVLAPTLPTLPPGTPGTSGTSETSSSPAQKAA